ncbi:MAG: carboxymuconolactone decarboxylase family protein [Frankiaceae bacterium]|nr:carboxymuconolactone decarboxylase family protein [Frankiaceae bacterium]MBV9869095.1 carboxymuconolactone decarboxylase family protein [Frankiaceae bacterium]
MSDGPSRPRITPLADDRDPPPLNIFRTLARNKGLEKGFLALGGHLLFTGAVPEREREIVILRVGWRSGSEYEFGQHTTIGRRAGLTQGEIDRLADADGGEWSDADAALVDLADELCRDDIVTQSTWDRLAARWTEEQLLELLVLAGYYRLVSGMLNSVGVALEAGTPGWPAASSPVRWAPRDAAP